MPRERRPGHAIWMLIVAGLIAAGSLLRPVSSVATHGAAHPAVVALVDASQVDGMRVVEDLPAPTAAPTPQVAVEALTITEMHPAPASIRMSPSYPGHVLKFGSAGPNVALIQGALHIKADGIFGPQTLAAVLQYQAANGLKVDGIVGPITWKSLFG